ncbi:MAG: 3-deoxy-8-phosphooctulonate synthase [Chitinophagaceae bacterium]|nr:3-deoxy-8-phosphooctulonate synthase [Chitinophagaceae bacterium]
MEFLNALFGSAWRSDRFFLLAGPCVVENRNIVMETATTLKQVCDDLGIPFVFKASYTKANRSSVHSFTGIGHEEALNILAEVRDTLGVPVVTDIHTEAEAALAAQYVDVLQIPAFLCRQTSLLVAAGETGKVVNIKKGQFLAPDQMRLAAEKVRSTGNQKIMLTERGTTFGYQDLVVDFRSMPIMKETGYPAVMDCTHALQQPNQKAGVTGGQPEYVGLMARCALAAGANGLFIETHPDPSKAMSDGANMLSLGQMPNLMKQLVPLYEVLHKPQ